MSQAEKLSQCKKGDRCPLKDLGSACNGTLYWQGSLSLVCSKNPHHSRAATSKERTEYMQGLRNSQARWEASKSS